MSTKEFYKTLFDAGEYACFAKTTFDTKTFDVHTIGPKEQHAFFTINPLIKDSTRADKNVETYRNFFFEFDEQFDEKRVAHPVEKKTQAKIVYKCGLPFSTCVDSAGKSLHWILSLQDNFISDKVEYTAVWKSIQSVINKTAEEMMGLKLEVDPATKNPSRFSRCPGFLRTEKVERPGIQTIKSVRGRIHSNEVFGWLESHGVDWTEYMPKPDQLDPNVTFNVSASDQEKIDYIMKWKMKDREYVKGRRHEYQLSLVYYLLRTGMSPDVIDATLVNMFGEISTGIVSSRTIPIETIGTPIYVLSKEEKIQWVKEQHRLENEAEIEKFTDLLLDSDDGNITNGEVADLNIGGLNNYIRVGTKYYRADDYSIELWDKQTIKDDFGTRSLHDEALRKFRGFVNEPNYLKRIEFVTRMEGEVPHSFYNKFGYPNWSLEKGEFPTTLKLLRKVFIGDSENQLEIGLDWIQLLLTKPKQKMRGLILVGPPETGKDTFMEWLISIVSSANGILISGDEIESPYNSSWAGKHVVCLNEVSYDASDKKTKERIKNLLTAEKLTVEGKGDNRYQIENYTKVIMATNNAFDFMQISTKENRFHVREMPLLKKEDIDTRFKEKLEAEKPAVLYWLVKERELWRKEKAGRFWHSNEECETEAGQRVKENTKSTLYTHLKSLIEDKFKHPLLLAEDDLFVRAKTLTIEVNHTIFNQRDRWSQKAVNMCLLKEFEVKDFKTIRKDAFDNFEESNNTFFSISRSLIEDGIGLQRDYFELQA